MKRLLLMTIASTMVSGCTSGKVIINGNFTKIGNQEIKVYVRDSSTEKQLIGETQSIDDKFHLKLKKIKTPTYAYLATIGLEVQFILEPGRIKISSGGNYNSAVSGTKYNNMLYGWNSSQEMIKIDSAASALNEMVKASAYQSRSKEFQDDIKKKYAKIRRECSRLENKALDEMFRNSDEYGQLFSILFRYRTTEKEIEELERIEKVIGKNGEIDYFRQIFNEEKSSKAQSEKIKIGNDFIDINALKADNSNVKLSDVVVANRLTILEFWASWCAPCRAEIPHMKKVYDNYKTKGLEILSFSVDTSKEAWLAAEKKENLPWISTSGDVKTVSQLYVVKSVPASILIDCNGKIVAKNLRGDELDKFIESFLK